MDTPLKSLFYGRPCMITTNSKNILLADDSVFFRTKLSAILLEAGHRVKFASDGRDVIREIQIDSYGTDLLILDLQMPNIDGFGVLEWMERNGYKGRFPVLVITGVYEPSGVVRRLKQLGASGLMTKGFTPEQVLYRVNRLLFPHDDTERENDRVPVSVAVDFTVGENTYTGFLLNLSPTGLFLHTRKELLPGTTLTLKFLLPDSEKVITAKGVVRWSTSPDASHTLFGGSGIMFTSVSDEDKALIREFVAKELDRLRVGEEEEMGQPLPSMK